ncbi:AIR synthase-related protein [Vulcanisaeta distributa]|uniref:AIR synthase-related protein n=1 Tax=Vulcanisaeta distributa TaxID=164451 RepID=UPI000AD3F264|nr:AIR synthase-related protein [Vulcanisaeta distributa]
MRRVIGDLGVELEVPEPPCIFKVIKDSGNIEWDEMYRVFNMGIGLVILTSEEYVKEVTKVIRALGLNHWVLGRVINGGGINILTPGGLRVRL